MEQQIYRATIYGVEGQVIYVVFDNGTYGVISGLDPAGVNPGEVYLSTYTGEVYNDYPIVQLYVENQESVQMEEQPVAEAVSQPEEQSVAEEASQPEEQPVAEAVTQPEERPVPEEVYQPEDQFVPEEVYQPEEIPSVQESFQSPVQNIETIPNQDASYQDSAFAPDPTLSQPNQDEGGSLPDGWNNWYGMELSHGSAVTALSSTRQFYDAYLQTVEQYRREMNSKISRSTDIRDKRIAEYEQDYKAMTEKCENMRRLISESVGAAKKRYSAIKEDISNYTNTLRAFAGVEGETENHISNATSRINDAINLQDKRYNDTLYALNADLQEEKKKTEQKIENAMHEYEKNNTSYRQEFQQKVKKLQADYAVRISEGLSEKCIHSYINMVNSSKINASHFVSSKTLPEQIYFGNLCIELDKSTDSDHTDISHIIEKEAHEIASQVGQNLKISMPYCQKYSEGLSLMVKYQTAENDRVKKTIFPTLLKMFMSFPAGKLEATMIDPLESGASFPDIIKLAGATSERVIDSKIWCTSSEIESAISTFGSKLQNLIQSYGDDKESLLKREELKVLAITDFPHGFSQRALETMQAIVRSSAMNGVIILIWTDNKELEDLRRRNPSLVNEIEQRVLICEEKNGRYFLDASKYGNMYLDMDPMDDILQNKDSIIATLANDIANYRQKIERFADLFPYDIEDSNNWFRGENDKISIPLGIMGASTPVNMILGKSDGSTEHHVLIAGQTGAGKSTLMHTIINSAMISYSPDDLQLYLVDFKEGIEFKQYTRYRLPNMRVVAVDSEREFGLNILKELCEELENRADIFSRNNVADINAYNRIASRRMPRILLIFDEVQELFRSAGNDTIAAESLSCVGKLVTQGRAPGIHIILSCQDFANCKGLNEWFSQFAVRIVVRGDSKGAASILDANNSGITTLQNRPTGSAIYNRLGGDEKWNIFFQISYIEKEERQHYLELMDKYYRQPAVAEYYVDYNQRTLLTNGEDDINNRFNKLINEGKDSIERIAEQKGNYGLILGQGFGRKNTLVKEFTDNKGDNLLIVGKDEKKAMGICEYILLSILYDELSTTNDATNTLGYVLDCSDLEVRNDMCDIKYLAELFPQIQLVNIRKVEEIINYFYETVQYRLQQKQQGTDKFEQIFFMIFGLNRVRALKEALSYNNTPGELTLVNKLESVFLYGPTVGVNSIVWSEKNNINDIFVGNIIERIFEQRIAYGLSDSEMDLLVDESESGSLQSSTAVYFDINEMRNVHFRPYNLPAKTWVEDIAEVYANIVEGDA